MKEWINWSGSLRFVPARCLEPANEQELATIIRSIYHEGKRFRLAAAGHSSSALVETNETLINLKKMKGLVAHAGDTATFYAGTTVEEANEALEKVGLALFNTGDVDVQTLAGAISTGTHGSGKTLQNLASVLHGARLVNYRGDISEYSEDTDPEAMRAMRVSLGGLGVFSTITVKVVPLFSLRRLELCTDTDTCMQHLDNLAANNRNLDFYWYPRNDGVKIRILNEPGKGMTHFSFKHRIACDETDVVGKILPRTRDLKFEEMEYSLEEDAGPACFEAVRKRVKERHRKNVAWRVLYRFIAEDDFFLSPHSGRPGVSISLHHNAGLPFKEYFNDIEPIFRDFGGRPHWAKKHNMTVEHLRGLYPMWEQYHAVRHRFDPEKRMVNKHLQHILFQND